MFININLLVSTSLLRDCLKCKIYFLLKNIIYTLFILLFSTYSMNNVKIVSIVKVPFNFFLFGLKHWFKTTFLLQRIFFISRPHLGNYWKFSPFIYWRKEFENLWDPSVDFISFPKNNLYNAFMWKTNSLRQDSKSGLLFHRPALYDLAKS